MLAGLTSARSCARSPPSSSRRQHRDALRPRRPRGHLRQCRRVLGARGLAVRRPSLITRNTNDVQQVQMLAMMGGTMLVAAPICWLGGVVMAVHQDVGLTWLIVVVVPVLGIVHRAHRQPDGAALPQLQERSTRSTASCASSSPASASCARSCASGTRRSASAGPTPTSWTSAPHGRLAWPLMFPTVMLVAQRATRRRDLVRRAPGRRRRASRSAPCSPSCSTSGRS